MNLISDNIFRIIARLKSPQPWVRMRAIFVLASWGEAAQPAISALVDTLGDESVSVRQMAAFALGEIGDEAAGIPALLKALRDDTSGVRRQAAMSLGKLAGEAAIPALRQAIWDSDDSVRKAAKKAIEQILPQTCRKPAA